MKFLEEKKKRSEVCSPLIENNRRSNPEIMIREYNNSSQSQQELINKLVEIPSLLADIFQVVQSKSRAWRFFKVFNAILSFINCKVIHPTRDQLAKMAGCSVDVVTDAIKYLELKGWLREVQHRYNNSNIYYISIIFYHIPLRKYLMRIFPACGLFLKWEYAVRVDAAGAVCQRTAILLYIDDKELIKKRKKKRQSCIITSSAFGRVGEAGKYEPPDYYLKTNKQPPTSGNQLIKGDGMRLIIAKVADMVPLADEQLAQLDVYTDDVIEESLRRYKQAKNVEKPVGFFMGIVRNVAGLEHLQPNGKWSSTSSQTKNQDSLKREARGALNDRYATAEITHCEKLLELFDKIAVEDPSEAQNIVARKPSDRWSLSWPSPDVLDFRLDRLRGKR